MATILNSTNNLDQTIRIFDSFYSYSTTVNASEYDLVHSFFVGVCSSTDIANNFTAAIFRISEQTGIPVMQLMDYIQGKNDNNTTLNMNATICYFLNSLKSKTALYGVSQVPQSNQPVARNILQ